MDNKKVCTEAFKSWLPLAVVIVILSGLVCVTVQQNYRMSANDPQIQIAEDIAQAVSQGKAKPDGIVPPNPTADISQSLSAFVVIFNDTGSPIGASVALDGKIPSLPNGVADYVKKHGEDRFTWEPKSGVRVAAVVSHFTGPASGFVLAGRLLREVEIRESNLNKMSALAAAAALVLTYLVLFFLLKIDPRQRSIEVVEMEGPDTKIKIDIE